MGKMYAVAHLEEDLVPKQGRSRLHPSNADVVQNMKINKHNKPH
jgi:hypothetical protein